MKNVKHLSHHEALVRDTRPNAHVENKAINGFWPTPLSKLLSPNHEFDCGYNDAGVRFSARFALMSGGQRIRVTLVPHAPEAKRHLTSWFSLDASHKRRANEGIKLNGVHT